MTTQCFWWDAVDTWARSWGEHGKPTKAWGPPASLPYLDSAPVSLQVHFTLKSPVLTPPDSLTMFLF